MKRLGAAAALVLAAFALSACESLMVATGLRMRLDGVPLQSIAASLPGNALAPGAKARLSVVATTVDGRSLATVGTGDGKVTGDSYTYEADVVSVDEDGVVKLPADPRLSDGRTPHVRIRAKGQAAPVADLDIPVRYDVAFKANYAGADGLPGFDGQAGSDGSSGSMGSFDPNSPSPGGDGGNGGNGWNGGNGGDGGDGSPGPDVQVWVALAPGPHPLLRIRTIGAGHDQFFLVDPAGGSLNLEVHGGEGGRAGAGGRAGSGGSGGPGSPSGSSGMSGMAGLDGMAGSGGPAGRVHVAIDPAAAPWLDRLHITNVDGDGHAGPAPEITIGPVASPW